LETDKFTIQCDDLESIIADINPEVDNLSRYTENSGKVIVLIGERYYFRIESNLAATIIIDRINANEYQIVIVSAGGKKGLMGVT
jgi:predicted nucleotide-binding protein (sugar kinase/HSP70/actin superfamily)